jgi:hypothetical protein
MHVCTISARRTGKTALRDTHDRLTPAAYFTLRLVASRYTPDAFARALLIVADHDQIERPTLDEDRARYRRTRDVVALLGRPGSVTWDDQLLAAITRLIPFDPAVYAQLADRRAASPKVCCGCGCSGHDACITDDSVCTWVTPALCSHCLKDAIAEQEIAR